jgi:hypothetical protein
MENDLLRDVASNIRTRLKTAARRERALSRTPGHAAAARSHLVATMREHLATVAERPVTQQLMELDLGVALLECATRIGELDAALAD